MINDIMSLLWDEHRLLRTAALKDSSEGVHSQCNAKDGKGHKSSCVALFASQSTNSTLQLPPKHAYFRRDNQKDNFGCEGCVLWPLGVYWFLLSFCCFLFLSLIKTEPDNLVLMTSCAYENDCLLLSCYNCILAFNHGVLKITSPLLQISGKNSQRTIRRTSIVVKVNEGEKFTSISYNMKNLKTFICLSQQSWN